MAKVRTQLTDANHRLSQLQVFKGSVARMLHARDLPECDILQKLQTICDAHHQFTMLSRRYDSPGIDSPCPDRSSNNCHQSPSSHNHHRRYTDSVEHNFDSECEYNKKY